jgi:hypothetical protein
MGDNNKQFFQDHLFFPSELGVLCALAGVKSPDREFHPRVMSNNKCLHLRGTTLAGVLLAYKKEEISLWFSRP